MNGFHLGPAYIRFYGVMYVIGITLAILITQRRWKAVAAIPAWSGTSRSGRSGRHRRGPDLLDLTTPKYIPHHWYGVFAVWDGGLGIWGGIALAAIGGAWRYTAPGPA